MADGGGPPPPIPDYPSDYQPAPSVEPEDVFASPLAEPARGRAGTLPLSHPANPSERQRARTVLPSLDTLQSEEELQALAQAQARMKHARELREQAERDAEAARQAELEAARRAERIRQIEQAAAEAEEEERRALAEARMEQQRAQRAKELKELEVQRQVAATEREKRMKELRAAAAKVEADEKAAAERTQAALQQQLAQQEEEERLLMLQTEARVAKAKQAQEQAEQERLLAQRKAELEQRKKEAEEAARREEQRSERAALQAQFQYDPKLQAWEDVERRLLKTYRWRLPTQDELNHSSEELVGETIFVKGYGIGTVREFQQSRGWGFHSSHLIDFAPLTFGLTKKSEVSVTLKRKQNTETPWLKMWDDAAQAQQAKRSDEAALQKRGHQLWQDTKAIAPTLAVRREAAAHRAAMNAEVLAELNDGETAQAEAIAASEARIAKAREERAAAEKEMLLAQKKAEQDERIRQLKAAAADEEAAQRRSVIQAEAQYTPRTEAWETAVRRLLNTYSWRVPTDEELSRVKANGKDVEGEIICVEGYGIGLVQSFKESTGWGSRQSHEIDFCPLQIGVKKVRLSCKRDHGTRWLKYVEPAQAAQARQAAESALSARSHQLWSDATALRGLVSVQHEAAQHRESREAAVNAQLSVDDAEEQELLAQAQERIAKAREAREARDREALLARKKAEKDERLRELNAAAEKEEAMTNRVAAQAQANYNPKQEKWSTAQARLLKTFQWRMPTETELEFGGAEESILLGKLVCVKRCGVGTVTGLKTGASRLSGSWYLHTIDFTPAAARVKELALRTKTKKTDSKWLVYVDAETAEKQRLAAEERAADLLHKRGAAMWKAASTVPSILHLGRESAAHRQAKNEALAAESAHQQEHSIMQEEHAEVMRKVDVLRSGGDVSDDSDDELELGFDEDDNEVLLPLRVATHIHAMARREQLRVAERVEQARATTNYADGRSDSDVDSDSDFSPPSILDDDGDDQRVEQARPTIHVAEGWSESESESESDDYPPSMLDDDEDDVPPPVPHDEDNDDTKFEQPGEPMVDMKVESQDSEGSESSEGSEGSVEPDDSDGASDSASEHGSETSSSTPSQPEAARSK